MSSKNIIPAHSFYFLRHGESVNNRDNLVNGWTDCPLTDRGREQARRAAKILKSHPINRIVTSDLQRAVETAEIVAEELGLPVEKYPGLRERNWGVYENKSRDISKDFFAKPDVGESWEEFCDRIIRELNRIGIQENNFIVGHAGVMRVLKKILNIGDSRDRIPNSNALKIEKKGIDSGAIVFLNNEIKN